MPRKTQDQPKSGISYSLEHIPPEIWIPVRQLAFKRHVTVKSLILTVLKEYVSKCTDELSELQVFLGNDAQRQKEKNGN